MSREDLRREFRSTQKSHRSVLGKVVDGVRKVAGVAVGVAVAASAVKHTADVVSGRRLPLLYPWGSMVGLPGALSFYDMMLRRAAYFNNYIGLHPYHVRPYSRPVLPVVPYVGRRHGRW